MLRSYEKMGFPVEKTLVEQYLQEEKTAAEFFSYYQIYQKYGQDYQIGQVLDGSLSDTERKAITRMAKEGTPQERSMVLAFLLAVLDQNIEQYFRERQIQKALQKAADSSVFSGAMMPERHSETGSRAEKKVCRSVQNGN